MVRFFLGLASPSVFSAAEVSPASSLAGATASAALALTFLDTRFLIGFFSLLSLCFSSAGFAISTMTLRPSSSVLFRSSAAFSAASRVLKATKP